jgi:hypothetical protein
MVRWSRTEQRERSGEGPGIRTREGVRRREQGRDGQAPGDGRVRAVGVLHNRGACRSQAQGSVRGAGSEAGLCTQGRWPGCHGSTQERPGRAECARAQPASRHVQDAVTWAGRGGTSGLSGSGRWCFIGQCYRRGARCAGGRTGRSGAARARGTGAPGSVLPAPGPAGAAPVAAGRPSARPAAGTGHPRSAAGTGHPWPPARPAWRAPARAASRQQPLQPDRDRDGPGAPPGPAPDRPARPGFRASRQPVRPRRPAARSWRFPAVARGCGAARRPAAWRPPAQPQQHAAAPGGRPRWSRRPGPRWSRWPGRRRPARWPGRPRCGRHPHRWRAAARWYRRWRASRRWRRPWPQWHAGRVRAPRRAAVARPQVA